MTLWKMWSSLIVVILLINISNVTEAQITPTADETEVLTTWASPDYENEAPTTTYQAEILFTSADESSGRTDSARNDSTTLQQSHDNTPVTESSNGKHHNISTVETSQQVTTAEILHNNTTISACNDTTESPNATKVYREDFINTTTVVSTTLLSANISTAETTTAAKTSEFAEKTSPSTTTYIPACNDTTESPNATKVYREDFINSTTVVSTTLLSANISTAETTTAAKTSEFAEKTSPSTTRYIPACNDTTESPNATKVYREDFINTTTVVSTTLLSANNSTTQTTTAAKTSELAEKTSTSTTTYVPDKDKRQRDLYPWGEVAGDSVVKRNVDDYYYWYDMRSQPIYFTGGVPFGSDKFTVAYVLTNGVITFGARSWGWWPNLEYAYTDQQSILAPFWFETNYRQSGNVYYHLYERKDVNDSPLYHKDVLDRANNEVKQFYGKDHFKAMAVLVATWEQVEPYTWYTWLCENYNYNNDWWWWRDEYYVHLYEEYCHNQHKETNTFQAVYVTDGQEAYVIVTYTFGEMKWKYEMWRNIAVGFVTSDEVRDYGVTYTDLTTKMDSIVWNTGLYGTWTEQVGKIVNPDGRCLDFYLENLHLITDSTHKTFVNNLFECPCNLERLGRQWWHYSSDQVPGSDRTYRVCYSIGMTAKARLEKLRGNPLNKLCCYIHTYPSNWYWENYLEALRSASYIHYSDPRAGHLLLNDPWYWWGNPRKSREEDFNPHKWCCEDTSSPSKFCVLFNEVRPDYGCSLDAEFITGAALGDPHIKTLDSREYTLNGLGEYILLTISEGDFMLQGRTQQAHNSQGNKTSATVFVAFAVKEKNSSTFQVELDTPQTGLVITACGVDVTRDFYKSEYYNDTHGDNSVAVTREDKNNRTYVIASFPSGISLEVYVGLKNLEFSTNIPITFKGKTRGLLGNFNGNPNDDFVLPDEKILTTSETDTERKIFHNFGKEWAVNTGNSVFKYPEGESALNYQFPDFEPIFREEVNQTTLDEATKLCGEENSACIFDYIATKDVKFAANTNNTNKEANSVKASQVNKLPVLHLIPNQLNSNSQWEVNHGQYATLVFQAKEADENDHIAYQLKGRPQNVTINSSGVVTYTPDSSISVVIGVQAKDSRGGHSSIIYLDIVVCPVCSGHGKCNKNRTREQEKEGGKFLLYVCNCLPAYTGDDCEEEVNACAASPCFPGQTCTDLTAAEQGENKTGYICGSCPSGFTEQYGVCADINECISNGTGSVCQKNAACTNTVGSYVCTCDLGFRQDPLNSSLCKDVDECTERTHKCDQICHNTEGSYSCSCFDGNNPNSDGKTCTTVNSEVCPDCKQVCIVKNGISSCSCRTGYNLTGETDCTDIDECASANKPCSQACQNTEGSFICSCFLGYRLAEDGVSCTVCQHPYYGDNCASMCICNGHGTCNHVRGCQCKPEWIGVNCNKDVDECKTNSSACPNDQICSNTLGSFSCTCPAGYVMNNGKCEDINECLDVLDHNCSLSMEDCINSKGSYSCRCREGYARSANGFCEDIDECAKTNHNCEQLCENTPGKYNCKCYYGYELGTDRVSCVKRGTDVCEGVTDLTCEHICTVDLSTNTRYCKCNSGYSLTGKEKCVDINECKFNHLNLCEYKDGCINKNGSYKCSCLPGSMLDNDGRSCVVCNGGKWGVECLQDCACSTGASHCDPKRGCICKPGYTGTFCEKDIDECSTGLLTCKARETCVNKQGSALCDCMLGYTRIGNSCQDINECASVSTNDCNQVCENYEGGYSCACNTGYQFNKANKTCEDINECIKKLDGCEQLCENSNGGYRCSCYDGLKLRLDGVSCVEVSKCISKACEEKCAVVDGKETCFCSKGKKVDLADDSKCEDLNLCANSPCSKTCSETPGGTGFRCACPEGQKLAADGFTCVDCTEGTYGLNCNKKCTCNAATTMSCNKIDGVCTCKSGWTSSNCLVDKNECNDLPCPEFSECINTLGGYVCKCNAGYFSTNNQCLVCPPNTYGTECSQQCTCDTSHSACDSVSGNCNCHVGWSGVTCDTDVNECAQENNCITASKEHWVCFNIPGSYTCDCQTGYVLDPNSGICVDLDECAADYSNKCDQNCTNTNGSYRCSCNTGYQLGSDGYMCEDINECQQNQSVCQQVCNNKVGTYSCSCQDGYQIKENQSSHCYEAIEVQTEITIPMDVYNKNLREQRGKDYIELKAVTEHALKEEFSKTVEGVTNVTVTQMRKGSVIIYSTTIIDKTVNPRAATDMVEAIILIFHNGVTISGTHYEASVKIGDLIVDATIDKCLILNVIEPCRDGEQCVRNALGKVYCNRKPHKKVVIPLVVGLSVGLPLGVALIMALAAALWYKKKFTAQKRVHSREGQYSDSDRVPSPEAMSYFTVGQSGSKNVPCKTSYKQSHFP